MKIRELGLILRAKLSYNFPNLINRLNRPYFVVGVHYGNQNRLRTERFSDVFRIYNAIFANIQITDFKALFFQLLAGMQNRVVLKSCGNDMGFGSWGSKLKLSFQFSG